MTRTLKVLLIIAIVISAVQVAALIVDLLTPAREMTSPIQRFAAEAELRWKVYLASAVASLLLSLLLHRWSRVAGNATLIAGIYLMVLANNGGLFARGYEVPRLVTSILTLAFLLLVAIRDARLGSGAGELPHSRADA
jgi:hypothetical protein